MDINFPYHIDGRGQTAAAGYDQHVRQMIEQVLFTAPGERVNRPDFGSGLMRLVFAPASNEVASAAQFQVQAALQRILDQVIQIDTVAVTVDDNRLSIQVNYTLRATGETHSASYARAVPS